MVGGTRFHRRIHAASLGRMKEREKILSGKKKTRRPRRAQSTCLLTEPTPGINPDSFGSNLAELAKGRQVIAVHLQAHGRTPDTDRPLRCETMCDDVAALIGH